MEHFSLWTNVPHGCYPDLPRTRVLGIRLTLLGNDGLLICHCVRMSTSTTFLSNNTYMHVTLYALSPCFSVSIIVTARF